jgi:hypothetical protein
VLHIRLPWAQQEENLTKNGRSLRRSVAVSVQRLCLSAQLFDQKSVPASNLCFRKEVCLAAIDLETYTFINCQTGLSENQQALLLASKSNYTHLLEGTRLPGVSYPESLSMGLTSKRTSHKIAEQGRRNRINEAIKEMQLLLPKTKGKGRAEEIAEEEEEANAKDGKGNNTAEGRSANSKAATVESAIDYIKLLQQEKTLAIEMLQKKDEEMAALRKQLQSADITTTVSNSSNDSINVSSGEENSAESEEMEGVTATP